MDRERLCRKCNNPLPALTRGRPWVYCPDTECRALYKVIYDRIKQREHRARIAEQLARLQELEQLYASQ